MDEQLALSGIQVHCKVTRMANLVENSNVIKNVYILKKSYKYYKISYFFGGQNSL